MSIIVADDLSKVYPVAVKEPGLKGTLRHFLRRTYREVRAVQGVSFEIEPGEVVGFLGPNGAGKTATLKMFTGLIHPSAGRVRVAEQVPFRREASFLQKITLTGAWCGVGAGFNCPVQLGLTLLPWRSPAARDNRKVFKRKSSDAKLG